MQASVHLKIQSPLLLYDLTLVRNDLLLWVGYVGVYCNPKASDVGYHVWGDLLAVGTGL